MCDAAEHTKVAMQKGYPCIFRNLARVNFYSRFVEDTLEAQLSSFIRELELLLPTEHQECLLYALFLVEKSFQHGIFIHSASATR